MSQQKYSKKREAILEKLRSTKQHPTAEWIYQELKPEYPELSLATVYRNLKVFLENGEVISVGIVNGQERFDARTLQHDHFICEDCNAVIDVAHKSDNTKHYDTIASDIGAVASNHHVAYYGSCKDCL